MKTEHTVRTFWEQIGGGRGRRLVREWVNAEGRVDRFEVVVEERSR